MRVVIVGAGQAGRRCAEALREGDAAAEIILLGAEHHAPYDRPPLSKAVLLGQDAGKALFPRDAAFYAEKGIALRTGMAVAALHPALSEVVTEAGEHIGYDALVLATGARARPLPVPGAAGNPAVHLLRTMEDAAALKAQLAARPRVVVVGGGLIGLEVAASARQLGSAVTVVEAMPRLMARNVPPVVSGWMAALHREHGVDLLLGAEVQGIAPGMRVQTSRGEVPADLVVVGIGGIAEVGLAKEAGLKVQDGIVVDGCGRTSMPGIWAAGEVARLPLPFAGGRPVRMESWQVAQNQPAVVARDILGQSPAPYDEVPWHWTDQFGWNVQVLGLNEDGLEAIPRPDDGPRRTLLLADSQGRLRGAVLVNNGRDVTPLRRVIGSGKALPWELLRSATAGPRDLMAAAKD